MGRIDEIVFDCARPAELARFWATLLDGYEVRRYDDAELARLSALGLTPETDTTVLVDGPGPSLCFQHAANRKISGRIHFDIVVPDREAAVQTIEQSGGTIARRHTDYTVMTDPEGNRFCIVGENPLPDRNDHRATTIS